MVLVKGLGLVYRHQEKLYCALPRPYLGESGDVDRESWDRHRTCPSSRRRELAVFAPVSSLD